MTYTSLFRMIAALAAVWSISGCSAITAIGDATTPLDVYELRPPATIPVSRGRPLPRDVIIELPTTSGALETDRIMIRPDSLQAQYLPEVRWSDPTPVMVQTLMLRALEASQGLRYVARRPLGARGDYAIVTELIDFHADLDDGGETATVRLRLVSRIVREDDVRIVASKTFIASAPAASVETDVLIGAFDTAAAGLLPDFTAWVLSTLRGR